jgi:putative copper resistance protein D
MAGIADFLDSLIGGFDLICYALTIGCLLSTLFLFQPWKERIDSNNALLVEKTITLIYKGGFWLTGAQLFKVILKIWLMTAILEKSPFPEFAETTQFIGGLTRATLSFVLASYVYCVLKSNPFSKSHWLTASLLTVPMIISGAWLVHGAGRFENQTMLMSLTVIHQVATAAWIGGVFQLLNVWQLIKLNKLSTNHWRQLLKKFTVLGSISVAVILLSGVPLALQYIDSWNGLIGTGYGNLLLVKITLLGVALYFANLNRYAAKNNDNYALTFYIPHYIEAETFVLITLLFTAASLASQPPAIDIPTLTASWQEVLNTFSPQIPRLSSPTHTDLISGEAGRTAIIGQIPSIAATEWSNYNHNIAGIFLTTMSFFAMLSYLRYSALQFCKFWSVGFVALGIFLFFRSDAETWPLGPIGFWDSTFNNGEVLQHRIATLLVFTLGIIELSSRIKPNYSKKLPFIFPILAAFGGLMLLTHSHVGFQPKSAFLIQVGHTTMGVFSLILACGRWLELNLDGKKRALAGFVSVAALFQIGIILMFYKEPLY